MTIIISKYVLKYACAAAVTTTQSSEFSGFQFPPHRTEDFPGLITSFHHAAGYISMKDEMLRTDKISFKLVQVAASVILPDYDL